MTSVVNIKNNTPYTVYIGRKVGFPYHWGNPFKVSEYGRDDCLQRFEFWMRGVSFGNVEARRRVWIIENLLSLEGEILGCHCKPKECHGDIYVKLLEEYKQNGKLRIVL